MMGRAVVSTADFEGAGLSPNLQTHLSTYVE